jgi:hypothetical protein
MNGNLSKGLYANSVEFMNDTDKASVIAGNYPIITKEADVYTKMHISETELCNYNNWDAIVEIRDEQWAIHGYAVPIVLICND